MVHGALGLYPLIGTCKGGLLGDLQILFGQRTGLTKHQEIRNWLPGHTADARALL